MHAYIIVRLCFYVCMCDDVLQPLPQKHSFKRFDRFNQEFVRTRMVALQNFLQRIADHPVLSFSRHFYTFLTAKQWVKHVAKLVYKLTDTVCSMARVHLHVLCSFDR